MAGIREMVFKGLGLHNDLQNEHSDRRQSVDQDHARPLRQRRAEEDIDGSITGNTALTTVIEHGSDATHMKPAKIFATRDNH